MHDIDFFQRPYSITFENNQCLANTNHSKFPMDGALAIVKSHNPIKLALKSIFSHCDFFSQKC
jgi:hypothetical protein